MTALPAPWRMPGGARRCLLRSLTSEMADLTPASLRSQRSRQRANTYPPVRLLWEGRQHNQRNNQEVIVARPQTVRQPPPPEELDRRRRLAAETLALRARCVIIPLTTSDLVRMARAEMGTADDDHE